MLHVREEDVPDHGDGVDVEHPVLGWDERKVDELGRRPDDPVKLEFKEKKKMLIILYFIF